MATPTPYLVRNKLHHRLLPSSGTPKLISRGTKMVQNALLQVMNGDKLISSLFLTSCPDIGYDITRLALAPIAQLDRASVYGTEG